MSAKPTDAEKQEYRRFLGCAGKHAYKSEAKALKAVRKYGEDFPQKLAGMNAYHCAFCEKWHIGHSKLLGGSVTP